ncbi:replication licensing factor Cdt1 [Schizosaccharomyces cryophilus OY26]|uniref:Replication licensing factor Cdt1 n=1 Tax=Schizosaccharomyces cryophilus (strain OY26 / ATCC MYA-4695 / CBS 11777 / NBRC 106824 / NRRL Y48691) TaxID=653667 RepID=S9X9T0_SCHCR|nr:replication licensing factor Cdt1 [Schizosaccharomyces cryophilus OY26]EPY50526.1 replication licensing factor Cdt1 [Schizosaccharomyces cryophilus OY26]
MRAQRVMRAGSQTTLPFSVEKLRSSSSKRKLSEATDSDECEVEHAPKSLSALKKKPILQDTPNSSHSCPSIPSTDPVSAKHPLEFIFSSLDICWNFHISINTKPTFHLLQQKVSSSTKSSFHLSHLAQILTIWSDAYRLRPCISQHQGRRIATYELQSPSQKPSDATSSRLQEFHDRLVKYLQTHPQIQEIPAAHLPPLPNLNSRDPKTPSLTDLLHLKKSASPTKKTAGLQSEEKGEYNHDDSEQNPSSFEKQLESSVTPVASKSSIKLKSHSTSGAAPKKENSAQLFLRQSSLFDRVRKKQQVAEAKKVELSKKDPVSQKLVSEKVSLVRVVDLIFVQLSTWPSKRSFSMTELVSSIQKSISYNMSSKECIDMVQLLSSTLPSWCSIHNLGNVQVVTFAKTVQGKPYLRSQVLSELNQQIHE